MQVFLSRYDRAITSLKANDPDVTTVLPDPGERSSDEAIRALLDDARRAMDERRQGEFQTSLNSIQELVTYAMDELDNRSHGWAPPGAQPEWPPLRELGRNLYPFREEILRQGSREYLFELLNFDYWLITTGLQRNCGELFSVALDGYRRNNQILSSIGGTDFQGITVDRFWQVADGLYLKTEPEEAFPFIREMIRHQERMLSDAMHADRSDDFTRLHRGLEKSFRFLRGKWEADNWQDPNSATLYRTLEQDYRIVLMGLSGRAAILAQDGKVAGMGPYAVAARRTYSNTDLLTNDLDQALRQEQQPRRSQWSEWEWQTEGEEDGRARFMFPEQYPFSFFSIRLMELVDDPIPTLNMHGNAKRVLDWFTNNSERLGRYVRPEADLAVELAQPNVNPEHDLDVERRRQIAIKVLERAVSNDEVQENLEIISRPLSDDRVSNFVSEVYATAFATDRVEPLFEQRNAFLYLSNESESIPEERGFHILEGKGFLTEMPEFSRTSYAPLEGDRWGLGISNDVIHLLCEALDDAPEIRALTDTPDAFLQAIDRVEEELNSGEMVIVLAGDWIDLEVELNQGLPEGYEPGWRLPDNERLAEMGRYRGHSILRGPRGSERRLYLVDPRNWGCLVRAQFENNQDLRVEVKPVSSDRAEKLLDANSSYFPDEPDGESKLRRLQTFVEIIVGARIEFRKNNGSRARQIINPAQNSDSNDAAQVVSGEAERTTTSIPALIP